MPVELYPTQGVDMGRPMGRPCAHCIGIGQTLPEPMGYHPKVKLCRFELKSSPGQPRAGMVYSGKIYETDGADAVAVHEAGDVRPLTPIPQPPSLRIFRSDLQPEDLREEDARFFYGNPACLVGASHLVNHPEFTNELSCEAYVAAVVAEEGYKVPVEEADGLILGLTLLTLLVARDVERAERGGGFGRSHDIAGTTGPVLTTPDELEDAVEDFDRGRLYRLQAGLRVNGVERGGGDVAEMPLTFAQALSAASQSCTLRAGDLVALGSVVSSDGLLLDAGDEIQLSVERLGMLATKIAIT